ncbi:MAG: LemA family protein [Candidatus Tyrphobacter sp.]
MQWRPSYALWIVLGIIVIIILWIFGTYNSLVTGDQAVQAQWGQVETAYQRRADLIPNLVATVKGAANFEKSTYIAVAQARSQVGEISPQAIQNALRNPQAFAQYQHAQDTLGSALTHLLAVTENYPQLQANQDFLTLQAQIEGTENRIAVERRRYNLAAQSFNTHRDTAPTVFIAGWFGSRFAEKPFFQASQAAQSAPQVNFPTPTP